jgi:hypothetical protein
LRLVPASVRLPAVTIAQTSTNGDSTLMVLSLLTWLCLGLLVGLIARSKGRNLFLWWLFGMLAFLISLILVLVLPRKIRPGQFAALPPPAIAFTNVGQRWQLGYTTVEPMWAIWERAEPGPPRERFPYTEEGHAQALARFAELEPQAAAGTPLPPPPGFA